MKEIQVSSITQRITLVDKEKGNYQLVVSSENNLPFKICVDTENNLDNNPPTFQTVTNGHIKVNIDADIKDIYEMMIFTTENTPFNIFYEVNKINQEFLTNENSKKIFEERKQKLSIVSEFIPKLSVEYAQLLEKYLYNVTMLYKDKQFEEADEMLNTVYNIVIQNSENNINVENFLKTIFNVEKEHNNTITTNDKTLSNESSSYLMPIIIGVVLFLLFLFLLYKFYISSSSSSKLPLFKPNKSNGGNVKNIFGL